MVFPKVQRKTNGVHHVRSCGLLTPTLSPWGEGVMEEFSLTGGEGISGAQAKACGYRRPVMFAMKMIESVAIKRRDQGITRYRL